MNKDLAHAAAEYAAAYNNVTMYEAGVEVTKQALREQTAAALEARARLDVARTALVRLSA